MVSNSVLRERARRQLGGGIFKSTWLKMMVALIILSCLQSAGSILCYVGVILLIGPVTYSIERICANRAKNIEDVNLNRIFDGFSDGFGATCVLGIMQLLFTFLWSLLLIIPGIVKTYSYSMASFIQQEQSNKEWKYCIDESKRLMYGNKWKLFCLDFSFIGWYMLGIICCFVGVFFVTPYHQMSRTNFFLELYYEDRGFDEFDQQEDLSDPFEEDY